MDEKWAVFRIALAALILLFVVYSIVLLHGAIPFLGALPGDVVVRFPGRTLQIPVVSSLLVALFLVVLAWAAARGLKK